MRLSAAEQRKVIFEQEKEQKLRDQREQNEFKRADMERKQQAMNQNRLSKLSLQMDKIGAGERRLLEIEEEKKYKALILK